MIYKELDIEVLLDLARLAGGEIMKVYAKDFIVDIKDDHSPLTEADRQSNKVIVEGLLQLYPQANIISEEMESLPYEDRKGWENFWLIDPLDGTKEFVKRNGEFTVNIALIEKGIPTFGVVYAPVPETLYYGLKDDGSYKVEKGIKQKLHKTASYLDKNEIRVLASRSHLSKETTDFVSALEAQGKKISYLSKGSSLKLCMVAEGVADVYPRFGPTMEWDTAAAHAVALYAGRQVKEANSDQSLRYNKADLHNPSFIVS